METCLTLIISSEHSPYEAGWGAAGKLTTRWWMPTAKKKRDGRQAEIGDGQKQGRELRLTTTGGSAFTRLDFQAIFGRSPLPSALQRLLTMTPGEIRSLSITRGDGWEERRMRCDWTTEIRRQKMKDSNWKELIRFRVYLQNGRLVRKWRRL